MNFGVASNGETVDRITLSAGELSVSILTWGAILQDVRLAGIERSLTLGSDQIADYEGGMRYHGSLIGPIVNRISTGRVLIDSMMYELERNQDGRIHLHSGAQATHRRLWDLVEQDETSLTLRCELMDGMCGLPGNRVITATFALSPPATMSLTIEGTTDAPTLMNFANHSYWNFDGTDTWSGHQLQINAERYLPCTVDCTPTGEIVPVASTPMDFNAARPITVNNPPFDNNFCLSDRPVPLRDVLALSGQSGVGMTIATDQSGIQVYDGRDAIRPGRKAYEGLAIEAQSWPDAPTFPAFPSIRVTPEQPYKQTTVFRFHQNDD